MCFQISSKSWSAINIFNNVKLNDSEYINFAIDFVIFYKPWRAGALIYLLAFFPSWETERHRQRESLIYYIDRNEADQLDNHDWTLTIYSIFSLLNTIKSDECLLFTLLSSASLEWTIQNEHVQDARNIVSCICVFVLLDQRFTKNTRIRSAGNSPCFSIQMTWQENRGWLAELIFRRLN